MYLTVSLLKVYVINFRHGSAYLPISVAVRAGEVEKRESERNSKQTVAIGKKQ